MSFTIESPKYFLLLLLLFPALLFFVFHTKKAIALLKNYSGKNMKAVHAIKGRLVFRTICWSFAWACICIALSGPTWGTKLIPVQKSGRAVSFVFDISHSMSAKDIQGKTITRLEEVQIFSHNLLQSLPGVATSAVLAKGDGVLSVPLTEDFYSMTNIIDALSPNMLSQPGSSLSKGVLKAIESFPPQSARSSYIVVCTDGDDTDGNLFDAVEYAINFGIQIVFVGFGSTEETEVLAGDGITNVKTALRSEKLQALAQNENVQFVLASDKSAVENIVQFIKPSIFFSDAATTTTHELAPIERHSIFILLAIVFFLTGFIVYVIQPSKIALLLIRRAKTAPYIMFIVFSIFLSGCNDWFVDAKDVLEGSYQWNQQEYQESVASFLEVTSRSYESENVEVRQYGLFGLSSSYLMQGELDASLLKINEMDPNVAKSLDFARWYNKGIIFHRQGSYETAAFCFKKALLVDSSNINAKINLELCLDSETIDTQKGERERIPVQEQNAPSGAAEAVFSLIRRNEENQWKTQEALPEKSDIIDY